MSGSSAAPPLVIPGRRGRAATWLRGRATPAGAILAVLPLGKAGVGSAVNDVTRELGGTFGVAVVGAVFSSVYGLRLAQLLHGAGLPAPALAAARQSPAAALQVAGHAPASTQAVIIDAANRAFVAGLSRGSLVCAAVVALGAVFAFLVLPRRLPATPPGPPAEPGPKPSLQAGPPATTWPGLLPPTRSRRAVSTRSLASRVRRGAESGP